MKMLKTNPFYILNIPMSADKGMIAAASEAALLSSRKKAGRNSEEAFAVLVNPEQRMTAEIDWFPGLGEDAVSEIRNAVRSSQQIDIQNLDLSGVSRLNAALWNLGLMTVWQERRKKDFAECCAHAVEEIAELYDRIKPAVLTDEINLIRQKAGIVPADRDAVDAAWQDRRQEISRIIDSSLKNCSREQYIQIFSIIADDLKGECAVPLRAVISDAIDRYEINTYAEAESLMNKMRVQRDRITGCREWNGFVTRNAVSGMLRTAAKWCDLVKPMMVKADLFKAKYEQGSIISEYAMDAARCIFTEKNFSDHDYMAHELIAAMALILGKNDLLALPFRKIEEKRQERARETRERFKRTGCYKICIVIVAGMILETAGILVYGIVSTEPENRLVIAITTLLGMAFMALFVLIVVKKSKNRYRKFK